MCSESDIKEMGLPMGPRKKLMSFVKAQAAKQEERKQELVKQEAEKAARLAARRVEQEMSRQQRLDSSMQDSSMSVHVDYTPGLKGTGQPFVKYPQLDFLPSCFFALGSPIGMFLTVRGVETVGDDFKLPTCDALFNIFHPFDPVAYRIEPLINKEAMNYKPVKALSTFGADLKRGLIDSMKKTWKTIHEFAISRATTAEPTEEEMEKIADQLEQEQAEKQSDISSSESFEFLADELKLGILNKGNRIDYVLQEKPIESFNEYLFALGSHACYWESEDTVLMILKEVYALHGILPQAQGPDKKRPSQTPPKNPVLPPP
uniref:SEC23-interacting protein-like n=1 Tax=Saccoglossus kowalevskii TaxID=10224 RepID=A0ABM0GUY9_SACKO|nr:PREDICTED: SEC23-interacting protein-like [Saccoglossus kowalevskii]